MRTGARGGRWPSGLRLAAALASSALLSIAPLAACSSDSSSSASGPTSPAPPDTAPIPAIPTGGVDCGTVNRLSGWPTTMAPAPGAYACIVDAAAAGTPARMVVVSPGTASSGRLTADGYEIPVREVVTWVVLADGSLEQTTDLTEGGGEVTVQTCAALVAADAWSAPTATGCG